MLLRASYWTKKSEYMSMENPANSNLYYWIIHVFTGLFTKIMENAQRENPDNVANINNSSFNNAIPQSNIIAQDIIYLGKILNERSKCFDSPVFIFFIGKMNEVLKKYEIEILDYEGEMLSLFVEIQNINNLSAECKEITLANIQFLYLLLNPRPNQTPIFPAFSGNTSTEIGTILKLMRTKTDQEVNESLGHLKNPTNSSATPERPDGKDQYYILSGNPQGNINNYFTVQQNNYYTIKSNEPSTAKSNMETTDSYFDNNPKQECNNTEKMTRKDVERYLGKKMAKCSKRRLSTSSVHQKISTRTLENMIEIQFEEDPSITCAPTSESFRKQKIQAKKNKLKKKNNPIHKACFKKNEKVLPAKQISKKAPSVSTQKANSSYFKLDRKYQELVDLVENPRKHASNLTKDAKAYLEKAKLLKEELNEFKKIYPQEISECLKDRSHMFMKKEFPTMYNVENFYENIYLMKKRRENISQNVCDVKLTNVGKSMSSNNLEISIGSKKKASSQNIVNINTMRKIWDPKDTDGDRIQDLLFNIEKKFPIEEFRWTQEVVLELLMKQNYDDEKLLNMLDELNFKQAIEERASQISDIIPVDDTVTKRLSLRRSTQTQQHDGVNLYFKSKS